MLPTTVGANSGTSLLGPSLLDGNSRDSFVSRSLADVAEVSAFPELNFPSHSVGSLLGPVGLNECSWELYVR